MPKEINTPEMNAKMEDCVKKVMATGKEKENAIRICKASIIKAHRLRQMSDKD